MSNLTRILTTLAALLSCIHPLCAESCITAGSIAADIESTRGILAPYRHGDLTDTRAPLGYRPFYISHYGRHGSRYHCDIDRLLPAIDGLELAAEKGLLTEEGKKLKVYVDSLVLVSDNRWGELTERGAREHRDIAARMFSRFRKVWKGGKRNEVHCISSDVPRCITSMTNSTNELACKAPWLHFSFEASTSHRIYLADFGPDAISDIRDLRNRQMLERDLDYSRFFSKIFNDPAAAGKIIPDPYEFCFRVFDIWAEGPAMQKAMFDIRDYMAPGEILPIAKVYSNDMYYGHMRGKETEKLRIPAAMRLLQVIVNDAGKAMKKGSRTAADLRYGHDTGLLALEALIGLEGFDGTWSYDEAADHINMADIQPKASNLQIIFYKRRSGSPDDCLVKFLVNEEETIIPALKPFKGPYYRWKDLKAYLGDPLDWYTPVTENKPFLRWWWLGSAVDREGLRYNLEEFADKGFGGVEITPLYGVKGNEANDREYLSPEWMEALKMTMEESARLGLQTDMSNCSGWPFGGPWIDADHAAGTFCFDDGVTSVSMKGTGQMVKRAGPGAEGLVMDHYSKEALQQYLEPFDKAFSESGCPWPATMFNDSFEVYGAGWTDELPQAFARQHGYRIEDHLKAFARNDGSPESEKVIADYRSTLSSLYMDNFVKPWSGWVRSHGMITRHQAHGAPANLIDVYAEADIPECEAFGQSPFDIKGLHRSGPTRLNDSDPAVFKFASSAAHLTDRKFTSCETLTWLTEHFNSTLALCKPELDLVFASGVNHVFLHGAPYSPKDTPFPAWKFYATVNLSPTNPSMWDVCGPLVDYITRCQAFLSAGSSDADFLLYFPEQDIWHHRFPTQFMQLDIHKMNMTMPLFKQDVLSILDAGYDVDYISDKFISSLDVLPDGSLLTRTGTIYKGLVLPSETRYMPDSTRCRINSLKASGARIMNIGDISSSGVQPETLMQVEGIHMVRRLNEVGGRNYFIANLGPADLDTTITLSCKAETVEFFDAMSGKKGIAESSSRADGRTEVRLQLQSGASMLVKCFPYKAECPEKWQYLGQELATLDLTEGAWTLKFLKSEPAMPQDEYSLERIVPWTELEGGTVNEAAASYSRTFQLSADQLDGAEAVLEMDDVRESAEVTVNGKAAGILIAAPFSMRIGDLLQPGTNTISITVRNLPANRIAQMDREGREWRIFKDVNIAAVRSRQVVTYEQEDSYAHWATVPSGLNSTVRITFRSINGQ